MLLEFTKVLSIMICVVAIAILVIYLMLTILGPYGILGTIAFIFMGVISYMIAEDNLSRKRYK